MNTLQLKREPAQGNAVNGTLILPLGKDVLHVATLENADHLIPTGIYPLKMSYSPKFNKRMPEICDVPGRTGIRIHTGTLPEHSTGCILVSSFARGYVDYFIQKFEKEQDENEQLQIEIC